jgi:hypothetical protein
MKKIIRKEVFPMDSGSKMMMAKFPEAFNFNQSFLKGRP